MSKNKPMDDCFFEELVRASVSKATAPSTLKSKIYSRLLQESSQSSKLLPLHQCKTAGYDLCFWEDFVVALPLGEKLGKLNHCRVCHGRLLGETIEGAPLPWANCPYAKFQRT